MKLLTFPFLLILTIFLAFSTFTLAKVAYEDIYLHRFVKDYWMYITKFSFHNGEGRYNLRINFYKSFSHLSPTKELRLDFMGFLDDDWEKVLNTRSCEERKKIAKVYHEVHVPANGTISQYYSGVISEKVDTRFWYFALADCTRKFPMAQHHGNKLKIELELINSDDSQFSAEESGLLWPHFIMAMAYVAFFVNNINKLKRYYYEEEDYDYPFLILTIACAIELLSLLMEWLHLFIVSYNGVGHFIPNFLSTGLTIVAQFAITCLLITVATGWSITYYDIEDVDLYVPLGVLIGALHLVIVGLGRLTEEDPFRYHDFDSWAGIVLAVIKLILLVVFMGFLVIKLILLVVFMGFLVNTYSTAHKKLKTFIVQFGVLGTLYIMAMPVVLLTLGHFVPPYMRHWVITVGNMVVQSSAMLILAFLFTSKRSSYYKVSVKGQEILPSNKLE